MKNSKYLGLLSLILLASISWSCKPNFKDFKGGQVELDLEEINILQGEWEFYWDQLLMPHEFHSLPDTVPMQYVTVPNSWTSYGDKEGNLYPSYGVATYRLVIDLEKPIYNASVMIPKIWSANNTYINGKLVYSAGIVSKNQEEYKNVMLEELISLPQGAKKLEFVIQVSNHSMAFASGLMQPFRMGPDYLMLGAYSTSSTLQVFLLGGLIFIGFYHFILYLFRPEDKSTLYFGALSILVSVLLIVFGDHELYRDLKGHWGILGFPLQYRLYYISVFSQIMVTPLYVESLYPKESQQPLISKLGAFSLKSILKPVLIGVALYLLFIVVMPPYISSYTFGPAIIVFVIVPSILILTTIARATSGSYRKEARLQLIGLLFVAFAGINDALFTRGILITGMANFIPVGFAVFMVLQFTILGNRFARAFRRVEDLSVNLEHKVQERTLELNEKNEELEVQTEELEKQNEQITNSVRYASRIQKATLPDSVDLGPGVKEHFILWKPKDIVSGDFYWSDVVEVPGIGKNLTLFVAADCTGHGVPGAFMTILGTRLLREIVSDRAMLDPGLIMEQLDQQIAKSLNQQSKEAINDGMDVSIILIDHLNYQVHYAGAKSPMYWLRKGDDGFYQEVSLLKGSKYPVGAAQQYARITKSFESEIIDYLPGDLIYLYSDGYQDQYNRKTKKRFMSKRFRRFLVQNSNVPLAEQQRILESEFESFKEETPQTDDVLVVGIKL